jgi:hypothetical protein
LAGQWPLKKPEHESKPRVIKERRDIEIVMDRIAEKIEDYQKLLKKIEKEPPDEETLQHLKASYDPDHEQVKSVVDARSLIPHSELLDRQRVAEQVSTTRAVKMNPYLLENGEKINGTSKMHLKHTRDQILQQATDEILGNTWIAALGRYKRRVLGPIIAEQVYKKNTPDESKAPGEVIRRMKLQQSNPNNQVRIYRAYCQDCKSILYEGNDIEEWQSVIDSHEKQGIERAARGNTTNTRLCRIAKHLSAATS